ncbi:ankyrin repeat-containing domain protein [Xylaria castorea]|nr:ankyrin repeat-containing domain protein [Xylaria castorea]
MDPLSGAASVVALVTLVAQLTKAFADFRSRCENLPARLHALNNEVADLALVLNDVAGLYHVQNHGINGNSSSSSIQKILSHLDKKLRELKTIVEGPLASSAQRRKFPLLQARAWSKINGRLQILSEEIRTYKTQLIIALEASNSRDLVRIRLDVETISTNATMNSQFFRTFRDEILGNTSRMHDRITGSLNSIDHRLDERMARLEELVIPHLPSAAPSAHGSDSTSRLITLRPRADAVGFRLRSSPDMCCRPGCRCACHQRTESASPAVLDRVLGQLFVGYSGVPFLRPTCDEPLCERPLVPRVSLEYWFPIGLFWSLIIQVLCTYTSNMGPSLQVRTIRRVPDNATCVEFAIAGNIEGLKYLFHRGLASPRDWALYTKQFDTCTYLMHQGADPDYGTYGSTTTALSSYKVTSKDRARSMLLEPGLSAHAETALRLVLEGDDWIDDCSFTQVHRAVVGLSTLSIEEAIQKNLSDLNAVDAGGRTPLAWAALRRDDQAVGLLLAYGADPNVTEHHGSTPLYNAAENGSAACCRLLLEAGALTDPPKPKGARLSSALVAATIDGKEPLTADILIGFGAHCEACGPDGKTALIHAARMDNARFASLLLDRGAKINPITAAGETPLTTAITYNSHNVLKLLLDRWLSYGDCPRNKGQPLLPIIARYADYETISLLKATNHIRQRHDKFYGRGTFAKQLQQRFDASEKLMFAFRDLVMIINSESTLQEESPPVDTTEISESILSEEPDTSQQSMNVEMDTFVDAPENPIRAPETGCLAAHHGMK